MTLTLLVRTRSIHSCELRIYELVKPRKSTTSALTTLSRHHTWHADASSTQFHVGQHMKKEKNKEKAPKKRCAGAVMVWYASECAMKYGGDPPQPTSNKRKNAHSHPQTHTHTHHTPPHALTRRFVCTFERPVSEVEAPLM